MTDMEDFFADNEKYQLAARNQDPIFTLNLYDLYTYNKDLSMRLIKEPTKGFSELAGFLKPIIGIDNIPIEKKIRITNLIETIKLRDIDTANLGELIEVEGIITMASVPEPEPTIITFNCPRCGTPIEEEQDGIIMRYPKKCEYGKCRNTKFSADDMDLNKTKYENVQHLRLQERPEELPPGEIPEALSATLRGDLIRTVSPGDRVKMVGILKTIPVKPRRLDFIKVLDVNSVTTFNRNNIETRLDKERIQQIVVLSQQSNLEEMLINSYCPSIYGWRHVKKALLRCIFGGVRKNKYGSTVRGDVHCLLTGDPGLAKTAMLLFGKEVCQRGVYDTGRGVTGVGLTAALVKLDEKFVLAAGTLALGDMGNVFLDEFEKMNKEDREMIHVPMENGIITVSKGGLKATLNSRCSVVAAMNPIDGRYNIYKTLMDNLRHKSEEFPDSLISRFDLIFIMVDEAKTAVDTAVANRMLGLEKIDQKDYIPIDLFRDYISYSKHINPTISDEVKYKIREYYEQKRQEMRSDQSKVFTPRQLESIERLVEARARMHLRVEATMEDLEDSLWLHEIYINETWKDPYTNEVDTGPMVGILETSRIKQADYLPRIIERMYRDGKGQVGLDTELYVRRGDLVDEMVSRGKVDQGRANDIIKVAIEKDLIWSPGVDRIKLSGSDANRMLGSEDNKP